MGKSSKKQSIREFVSEDSLKFQLYLLKFSNQLKQIQEKSKEDIIEKWNYDINKKIKRFTNDIKKIVFEEDKLKYNKFEDVIIDNLSVNEKDSISIASIKKNIIYIKKLPAPTSKKMIIDNFEKERLLYIESLKLRIKENKTATLKIDSELLVYAENIKISHVVSKEKFGIMLLLIIKNLGTMPSFSGYSDNWKTDFFSNAIEKTLLYLDNFDESLLSKRTGEKSKAFAYVTQICFNAFINIINIRKKEELLLKDTISLESANLDGIRSPSINQVKEEEILDIQEHLVTIKKIEHLDKAILKGIKYIEESNNILSVNRSNILEIEYLLKNTPIEEQNKDFYDFIKDLKSKINKELNNTNISTLKIIKPHKTTLGDWEFPDNNILKDIKLIITEKPKKVKKVENIIKPEAFILEDGIRELKEFNDEW